MTLSSSLIHRLQAFRDSALIPKAGTRKSQYFDNPYHLIDQTIDSLQVGEEAIRRVGLAREALVLLDDRGPGGLPDFKGLRNKILEIIGGDADGNVQNPV